MDCAATAQMYNKWSCSVLSIVVQAQTTGHIAYTSDLSVNGPILRQTMVLLVGGLTTRRRTRARLQRHFGRFGGMRVWDI